MNEEQKKELLNIKTYWNWWDNFHCKVEELSEFIDSCILQARQEEGERIIDTLISIEEVIYSDEAIERMKSFN